VLAGWHVPGTLAAQYLSRAQARAQVQELTGDLTVAAMDDHPIAFASAGPITTVDFSQDGWVISQATSIWVMTLRDTWQDTDVHVQTINTVVGEAGGDILQAEP
jgi:hypothetical protein